MDKKAWRIIAGVSILISLLGSSAAIPLSRKCVTLQGGDSVTATSPKGCFGKREWQAGSCLLTGNGC